VCGPGAPLVSGRSAAATTARRPGGATARDPRREDVTPSESNPQAAGAACGDASASTPRPVGHPLPWTRMRQVYACWVSPRYGDDASTTPAPGLEPRRSTSARPPHAGTSRRAAGTGDTAGRKSSPPVRRDDADFAVIRRPPAPPPEAAEAAFPLRRRRVSGDRARAITVTRAQAVLRASIARCSTPCPNARLAARTTCPHDFLSWSFRRSRRTGPPRPARAPLDPTMVLEAWTTRKVRFDRTGRVTPAVRRRRATFSSRPSASQTFMASALVSRLPPTCTVHFERADRCSRAQLARHESRSEMRKLIRVDCS